MTPGRAKTCLTVILGITFFLTLVPPTPGHAQQAVSLTGQVINGTADGDAPGGLTVLLLVIDGEGGLVSSEQTTTGDQGAFDFLDVPVVAGGSYLLDVEYQGTAYREIIPGERLEDRLREDLRLTVYETSTEISVIRLKRQVMVITAIDPRAGEITAIEFVRISNPGDRTVVPDLSASAPMGFLRFSLPPGTTDLSVNSDLPSREVITIGTGFAITSPITPGEHSIEYSYRFPYQDGAVSYRQRLLQGAEVYQLMAPQAFTQLQVSPLTSVESVDIEGTQYKVWEASNLAPGEGFQLELTNLPRPSLVARVRSSIGNAGFWVAGIPALMGVALACVLLFGILTRPPQTTTPAHSGPAQATAEPGSRVDLVRELAVLDLRYEAGETPEDEYQAQRQRLKAKILDPTDDPVREA